MRKISLPIYVISFVVTVVIFAIGVYIGMLIDNSNVQGVGSEIEKTNQLALSSQLMFLLGDSEAFCPFYAEELEKLDAETESVGLKVSYLEDIKGVQNDDLKKQYFVLETNAYLLSQKVRARCGGNFTTILYFYSNKNCSSCTQQGYDLIALKQKLGENVRIYSFDGDLGSSLVEALKNRYGVKSYPTMVIGENKTITGPYSTTRLEQEIK